MPRHALLEVAWERARALNQNPATRSHLLEDKVLGGGVRVDTHPGDCMQLRQRPRHGDDAPASSGGGLAGAAWEGTAPHTVRGPGQQHLEPRTELHCRIQAREYETNGVLDQCATAACGLAAHPRQNACRQSSAAELTAEKHYAVPEAYLWNAALAASKGMQQKFDRVHASRRKCVSAHYADFRHHRLSIISYTQIARICIVPVKTISTDTDFSGGRCLRLSIITDTALATS